jgi:hypothetical protein
LQLLWVLLLRLGLFLLLFLLGRASRSSSWASFNRLSRCSCSFQPLLLLQLLCQLQHLLLLLLVHL